MPKPWGDTDPDDRELRTDTDMYGKVTWGVHEFLRDRAVTPAEWQTLVIHFGADQHTAICEWVRKYATDAGRYDAYHSERALDGSHR